jgi:hypothetical protein
MADLKSVLFHSSSVVTRKMEKEYVIVPVTNNIADMKSVYTINETGAFIWDQIDGKNNVGQIIAALTEKYDIDYSSASGDVFDFIDRMQKFLTVK